MIRNSFIIITLLFLCLCPLQILAQDKSQVESQMDAIKLDEKYVYGEATDEKKEVAYNNAISDLLMTANQIRADKGKDVIATGSLQTQAKELGYVEESRYTVFLYIPIDKVLSINNQVHRDVVNETRKPEAPKPQPAKPVASKPAESPSRPVQSQSIPAQSQQLPNDVTRTLCSQDNWVEIKPFLSKYKSEGAITQTKATTSISEVPDNAYAILIDGMGGILAVLSPSSNGKRTDFKSGNDYNESNTSNCKFIVWYK